MTAHKVRTATTASVIVAQFDLNWQAALALSIQIVLPAKS